MEKWKHVIQGTAIFGSVDLQAKFNAPIAWKKDPHCCQCGGSFSKRLLSFRKDSVGILLPLEPCFQGIWRFSIRSFHHLSMEIVDISCVSCHHTKNQESSKINPPKSSLFVHETKNLATPPFLLFKKRRYSSPQKTTSSGEKPATTYQGAQVLRFEYHQQSQCPLGWTPNDPDKNTMTTPRHWVGVGNFDLQVIFGCFLQANSPGQKHT